MNGASGNAGGSWEQEGARLAPLLDEVHATVIAASDPDVAARIALGIGNVQGARRRVAIADLVGESQPLEALLTHDDPHGISDSFLYGVSLNKIARPIGENGSVFVMPSGTESVAIEPVYANERWRRLAAGFHQVGALLLVVAVPGTPGFSELCGYVGALMPVGPDPIAAPPGVRVIAPPAPATPTPREGAPSRTSAARARAIAAEDAAARNRKRLFVLLVLAAIGVIIGANRERLMPLLPQAFGRLFGAAPPVTGDSTSIVPPTEMQRTPTDSMADSQSRALGDSLTADSLANATLSVTSPPLAVENPADSARASRFAVYYAEANTPRAATLGMEANALPAVAMTPVLEGSEQWYRVTIGATETRRAADSLLAELRTAKVVMTGGILNVPYALRLEDGVDAAAVPARLTALRGRGLSPYALRQTNGRATIVTGAFESPMQARILADSLQKIGITPVLVYRTGRAF